MTRVKYLGGLSVAELKAHKITPEENHVIELDDTLAETLLEAFPVAFVLAGERAMKEAPTDRMVKGAPQNRSRA